MSSQRLIVAPARWFERFVTRPQVQATFGALLICVSLVVAYLAKQSYEENRDTKDAAKAACERSRQFGPSLIEHFESFDGTRHALDAKVLEFYRATVPKTCPK